MAYQKRVAGGHDGTVGYQIGQSICPRCGSGAEVQTIRDLFDTMNGAREQAFQRANQFRQPGQAPGQWQGQGPDQAQGQGQWPGQGQAPGQGQWPGQAPGQGWNSGDDDDYDHYNVEG